MHGTFVKSLAAQLTSRSFPMNCFHRVAPYVRFVSAALLISTLLRFEVTVPQGVAEGQAIQACV